ncbi:MAG: hypothetical protein VYA99_10200 [Pseudomonadota bacterium]|nr:hypothetical protein [Pseudomonadota bacterium]
MDKLRAEYKVISNNEVYQHDVLALNWLRICRRLHLGRHLDTQPQEIDIMVAALSHSSNTIWDLIKPHHPNGAFEREVALWRRAHKGDLKLHLTHEALHYDMEVTT